MKKTVILLLVLMLAVSFCGCGKQEKGDTPEPETNRLEEIKARGYIEVVMEPYFSPYEFIDPAKTGDEQYVGVDVEIARYIADKLGVELKIVPLEFSAVLAGITEGKYDLAISALAYTPVRAESMNMSDGYYFSKDNAGYGLLVREEDIDKYTTVESLKDAVVVMQSGSIQELFVTEQIPEAAEYKRVSATTDGFMMVSEGRADACACDVSNGQLYADANGGVAIANNFRFTYDETTQGTRIGIPLGEDELTAFVNEAIAELRAEGKIDKWYEEYSEYATSLGVN